MQTDILIVGAGLSGLTLARTLQEQGRDVQVLEARDRPGGRILSASHKNANYDMGPAWFWQGQERMAALVREHDLTVFEQFATGNLVYQDGSGAIRTDLAMAPMAGSLRLDGGLFPVIEAQANALGPERLHLSHMVHTLTQSPDRITAHCRNGSTDQTVTANQVVLAVPPRVAAKLTFSPPLSLAVQGTIARIPTWMAGHAKLIAIYPKPFWREAGLSGDAISHLGPLGEIHDASPADASAGALFGFVGVLAEDRTDQDALQAAALQQLTLLFGPKAGTPDAVLLQDWAQEPLTATRADHHPPTAHPDYGMPRALSHLWEGRLHVASSEMAATFGGYLEGALEAAEATAAKLLAN